jgi:hypothetical protein
MKILTCQEIEYILAKGGFLSDDKITLILDELEREHPGIYRMIYGEPSEHIASINKDMAKLYLDLSFDVVWIFRSAFGNPPKLKVDSEKWVVDKLSLLDPELKSLIGEMPMHGRFRKSLQERFIKRSIDTAIQFALLKYIEKSIKKYTSFQEKRKAAMQATRNWLFIVVRLMGDLYEVKSARDTRGTST